MDIQIEQLQPADLQKYKHLIGSCFGGSNDQNVYKDNYKKDLKNYQILVAKNIQGEILGSLTFYRLDLFTFSFQPALEVFNVCVLEEYRGQKVAKKLFEYMQDFAKKNDYKSIHLTCLDTATDAHRFYESVGMEKSKSVKYFLEL